ncbi:MAG: hypothetical protein GF375_02915 [Candidatus Omnitrophica bacterium]|nr:hypothetical protein [Candidatus Omnitrophota bacterium]MBD3269049.1 hypothetical protein [Candidatus Omnitrophota bacterium]
MEANNPQERRRYSRMDGKFVVSYKIKNSAMGYDLSQTRNVCQKGLMLTTGRYFEKGVVLEMSIRFPFIIQKIKVNGEVVDCKEVVGGRLYETRVKLLDLDENFVKELSNFIERKLKGPGNR